MNQIFTVPTSNGVTGGTYYFDQGGHYIINVWKKDNVGNDYYFNSDGRAVNGLHTIGGVVYDFANYKVVKETWQKIDQNEYYFDQYGHAVDGWQIIGGAWYYFNNHCLVMNQIFTVPTSNGVTGGTYYFDKGGHYLINTWQKDSQTMYHYFGKDGREQK